MKANLALLFLFFTCSTQASSVYADSRLPKKTKEDVHEQCDLHFRKLGFCGEWSWVIKPQPVEMITEKDKAELDVTICPRKAKLKKGSHSSDLKKYDDLHVRLWMPSMGHGSRPTKVRLVSQEGVCRKFKVEDLYFTMTGDWEIQFELKQGQKILDQTKASYDL
jgi:hypothetical protein